MRSAVFALVLVVAVGCEMRLPVTRQGPGCILEIPTELFISLQILSKGTSLWHHNVYIYILGTLSLLRNKFCDMLLS